MSACRLAIVAALEREVHALVKDWDGVEQQHEGHRFRFYENESAVLVCGGIGAEAARRASEAIVKLYHPELLVSAGFAGALDPELKVGQVFLPSRVIDAKDNSSTEIGTGHGILISLAAVASPAQKSRLASAYGGQAVDMEAAAVALSARKHGIGFAALKTISDDSKFEMPPVDQFVTADGQFRTGAFIGFAVVRPRLWLRLVRLSQNSSQASRSLCGELDRYIREAAQTNTQELQTTSRV